MTRAKICGITTAADRDVAVAAGADAVGFIVDVSVDTPREIPADRAATLAADTPPFVTTVLVTMPDAVQAAVSLQREVGADAVQVHGTPDPEFVGGLARRIEADVLVAVAADDPEIEAYATHADALLVDALDDDGGGGTGETTDWERAADLVEALDVPVVLAGGLTPDNVATAIDAVDPYGVDTASGVEREGGRKDASAVRRFVGAARGTVVEA